MSEQTYQIAPLEWKGRVTRKEYSETVAYTPFGRYRVVRFYDGIHWGYCFDDYYDEETFPCDSVDEGKRRAEQNWIERLSDCLIPAKPHPEKQGGE